MKARDNPFHILIIAVAALSLLSLIYGCNKPQKPNHMSGSTNILFLHHSTGKVILLGNTSRIIYKLGFKGGIDKLFADSNKKNGTNYRFSSQYFPKQEIYGWKNYPFDYYNIWVRNAGDRPFQDEPTLEILTKTYNVIIFKHCFPVSNIVEGKGAPDIDSEEKTLENYKLQYGALKEKLKQFPETKFIVWTGAALVKNETSEGNAIRAREFFNWVVNEWDEQGDNIYLWDFRKLETEGGLYLPDKFANSANDSHPAKSFAASVMPLFYQRIIDVIENRGDSGSITGEND
jgi:hypothetical protein